MKKLLALVLLALLALSALPSLAEGAANDTLVVATAELSGVFNPFFVETTYDREVLGYLFSELYATQPSGELTDGLAEYLPPLEVKDAAGETVETVYTIRLKEGLFFSDGSPLTIDDVLFTLYVYLDPSYDGTNTLGTLPIKGLDAYRCDEPEYAQKLTGIEAQVAAITPEQVDEYIRRVTPADVQGVSYQDLEGYVLDALGQEGLDQWMSAQQATPETITEQQIGALYAQCEVTKYHDDYVERAKADLKEQLMAQLAPDWSKLAEPRVPEIEGIEKLDERSLSVTLVGVDPSAQFALSLPVASRAAYGQDFKKGDVSGVKAVSSPVGAGAYRFVRFADNVVSLEANEHYYRGCPKIAKVKCQVVPESDKLDAVIRGDADVSDPTADAQSVSKAREAGLEVLLVDDDGWGNVGINCERVPDLNVRRGLMHLMNRQMAVDSYYGELAEVLERPMSKVCWAYPADAQPVYPYDADRALQYFEAAGYQQVTREDGSVSLEKDGQQLRIQVGVGAAGQMETQHPAGQLLISMKLDLEALGGALDIQDVEWSVFVEKLIAGEWDLFASAWDGAGQDPDMTSVFSSTGANNDYRLKDEELDRLISEARRTLDIQARKQLYAQALDRVMDAACCMPFYQRKHMVVVNPQLVDVDTLPQELTPFYGWDARLEALELAE